MENSIKEAWIEFGINAHKNPMDCNMFEKKCTLLTCHTKRTCLWTKYEAEKEKNSSKGDKQ